MDYTWMFYKNHENITALLAFFEDAIRSNPEELIRQIEGELETSYVFEGNNQQGRSLVQQSAITGIIEALEAVRAECLVSIKKGAEERYSGQWIFPMVRFTEYETVSKN